jgi:cysteine desulfurase
MHVNNEVGSVQPVKEIGSLLKARGRGPVFHVDGVQSVGKVPIDLSECGIDLFTASAHKVGGPRGVGLLYVHEGLQLNSLLTGGLQEYGLRPGTENVAAIVSAAKAFRLAAESLTVRRERMYVLRSILIHAINEIPELVLNGSDFGRMAPHIVNFSYPGMKPEVFVHMLEKHNILASTKSACSSKDDKPSRVLEAMGAGRERASSGIRISFGDEHVEADLEYLCETLRKVVQELKPLERKDK